MKITCVGGGPAGLYFAVVAKLRDPSREVEVVERNPPGTTYGWGVVYWDSLRLALHRTDPASAREIAARSVTRDELLAKWNEGWSVLTNALSSLSDDQLEQMVKIRSQPLTVAAALHRSLAHTSYHVGQIVYIAKSIRGADWNSLSIPRGKSDDFNRKMMEPK